MASSAYYKISYLENQLVRRAVSNDCSGWSCLSDAAQMGIILVLIASLAAVSYLYWRFKIKPNLQAELNGSCSGSHGRVSGYWEVTRRDPNRVSITIYPEPRSPPRDEEHGLTETRDQGHTKGNCGSPRTEEITTDQAHNSLGYVATPDIHVVPPQPPPIVWAVAPSSTIPPPPPFGPPVVLAAGPSVAPLQAGTLGFGTTAGPCQPDVPPPYFGYAAPQNTQIQHPGPDKVATAQPTGAPPPARPSVPPRDIHAEPAPVTPATENRGQRRRWFFLGNRSPTVGHARTLSNSSSAETRSKSPSPPPPSVSPPSSDHGGRSSRHRSNTQPRPFPSGRRETRRHRTDSSSRSESGLSSSYINASVEVVFDNQHRHPQSRHHVHQPGGPDRRGRRDGRRDADLAPSDMIPLSRLGHSRRRSFPGSRRQPSPDIQFPSPERRRASVSFEVPRDSDVMTTTCSSQTPEPPKRSGTRARRSQSDSHDGIRRQPSQSRRRSEQPSLAGQIIETFYLMRRPLRGEEQGGRWKEARQ
ncbi:hypothetical protein N657DRAFT_645992 [Parathielavia appendiculata]|uniref:Uncharacterized protein n=1 Tax=Parathielavia appendiculata TaxID=2587402 RepID=A0AAN6TYW0_9PEZI|nr:hypothetical protein N657DRAFT_645992 [Parathielavia appendiculata]